MTDRDLTPDEARAEVEAFLGEGWRVSFVRPPDFPDRIYACAWLPCVRAGDFKVRVESPCCLTARAAVSALKQAWRDAVRPWVVKADSEGFKAGMKAQQYVVGSYGVKEGDLELDVHRVARVLGEDK